MSNFENGSKSKAPEAKLLNMETSKPSKGHEGFNGLSSMNPELTEVSKVHQTHKMSLKLNGNQHGHPDQTSAKVSAGTASIGSAPGDIRTTRCSEQN